jgi:hypothetical protein
MRTYKRNLLEKRIVTDVNVNIMLLIYKYLLYHSNKHTDFYRSLKTVKIPKFIIYYYYIRINTLSINDFVIISLATAKLCIKVIWSNFENDPL